MAYLASPAEVTGEAPLQQWGSDFGGRDDYDNQAGRLASWSRRRSIR